MQELLTAFHMSANKGSLHVLDKQRLFAFAELAADSYQDVDEINQEIFYFLTKQDTKHWHEDTARALLREIRFGIELLRYRRTLETK
ncbi:hypothetical protein EHF33_03520 [Deinococcus psychrotolerans]|uniref:Uncharacterized protein n=1 Tax=Deinococcus psychrotolerans TaxID=2489213 RepID=A0A3G8YHI6_9DEIO|nr:hypothetical protein [Deinococcus psychrotolerans]AZI41934.1 hypothetical protein EHF33_03520 [Deinococcus psychrotolerans]